MDCDDIYAKVRAAKAAEDIKAHKEQTAFLAAKLKQWGLDVPVNPETGQADLCGVTVFVAPRQRIVEVKKSYTPGILQTWDYPVYKDVPGSKQVYAQVTGCKHGGSYTFTPPHDKAKVAVKALADLKELLDLAKACREQTEKDAAEKAKKDTPEAVVAEAPSFRKRRRWW